jgi:hypothetical protein
MIETNSGPDGNGFRVWCEARTTPECVRHQDATTLLDAFILAEKFIKFKGQHVCIACTQNYHQYPFLHPAEKQKVEALPTKQNSKYYQTEAMARLNIKLCVKHRGEYITAKPGKVGRCKQCARENGLKGGNALKAKVAKDPGYWNRIKGNNDGESFSQPV